jgi:hypothetical protein
VTDRATWPPLGDFDVLAAAATCSLIAGALSLLAPFLTALTATLVALTFAGWCSSLGRQGRPARAVARWDRGVALAALGLSIFFSLAPVGPILPFRGLILGSAAVPLWWVERRRPTGVVTHGVRA